MGDDREEIARIIDHEGYWERLDSCNHALATVSMTDDQRRALTAVRDDELRGTASSLAKADAILARQGPARVCQYCGGEGCVQEGSPEAWTWEPCGKCSPGPGEAVAWRYRFKSQWAVSGWSYADGPERPDMNEWDGFSGYEVEPLYAGTPTRESGNQGSSQGCGTGHSADAGSLPALAVTDVRENWELTDEFGWATPTEVEEAIAILSQNNGDLAYKIQGCFARGGAFAAPVDGDGNLAACAREAGWALSENVDRLPWERRGRIAAIVQKLGAALLVYPDDGGEAVHSPDEREGSREANKNDLAHPQKGGEG